MDKQREEFEAWVREYGNYPRRPELKTSDGAYHYLHTESEWRAWQAAQAAQPAQIPDAQQPFGWYDPSEDKFSRDRDAHKRGATLWLMFSDAVAPYHMPAAGEMVQQPCTPEEAARICSTLGPVPDGKTWAQHMVDTARTGWVPSTMGHAEYLVEPWPILGGS